MAVTAATCAFGAPIPDFALPDARGHLHRLADLRGPRGTLVMFICNHCPYVQAILPRILRDARELQGAGIGVVAISSNDAAEYPEDAPGRMAELAEAAGFTFPYLHDEDQSVARAFGAECTPEFLGYNAAGALQYHGRLDASGKSAAPPDARRELYEAMLTIAATGVGPREQVPAMGCSIKWKAPR